MPTLESLKNLDYGNHTVDKLIIDDYPRNRNPAIFDLISKVYGFNLQFNETNLGLSVNWSAFFEWLKTQDYDYILHQEDDVLLTSPIRIDDLITILEWNQANGITLFRLGSELFPRWNHYELADLPQIAEIAQHLRAAGDYAKAHGHRITTHPGPFHILGSPDAVVVDNSIVSLERHSELFDLMGFAPSFENLINIHIGATYNDKPGTIDRWLRNYNRLSDSCKARLVIENDDKASMYSVRELYKTLYASEGIPVTFDYWHHTFNTRVKCFLNKQLI
jgi:UV damage endonuclease UvdE